MSRAGRERAEDVKRRLVAACEEVGLNIQTANMIRDQDGRARLILVGAIPAGWNRDTPLLPKLPLGELDRLRSVALDDGLFRREIDATAGSGWLDRGKPKRGTTRGENRYPRRPHA